MQATAARVAIEQAGIASKVVPGQRELAGPVDQRMAGQDLLDQRRSRTRQADDEDRPPVSSPPWRVAKKAGSNAAISPETKRSCSAGSCTSGRRAILVDWEGVRLGAESAASP